MRCRFVRRVCRECEFEYEEGQRRENLCPECGADMQCPNNTKPGYKRCGVRGHGGPAPGRDYYGRGRDLVTGENSKFPLTRLAAKYHELTESGRFLSNRQSIEIITHRIIELSERIDLNQAPDRLMNLLKLWKKFQKARYSDELEMLKVQKQLDAEFEATYHDYAAWKQMFDAVTLRKDLVESEVKIAKDMKAIMTAEDGYEMLAKVFAIILDVEDDPQKLKRYQYEFTQMVGDGAVVDAKWEDESTT